MFVFHLKSYIISRNRTSNVNNWFSEFNYHNEKYPIVNGEWLLVRLLVQKSSINTLMCNWYTYLFNLVITPKNNNKKPLYSAGFV